MAEPWDALVMAETFEIALSERRLNETENKKDERQRDKELKDRGLR